MIGVDVVDHSCSFHSGKYTLEQYKNRILLEDEMKYCNHWWQLDTLWAIKESVYKCNSQLTGKTFYNPKRIRIVLLDTQSSIFKAQADDLIFSGRYICTNDYVSAICVTNDSYARETQQYLLNNELLNTVVPPVFETSAPSKNIITGFTDKVRIGGRCYPYSRSHHGRYYFSAISLSAL